MIFEYIIGILIIIPIVFFIFLSLFFVLFLENTFLNDINKDIKTIKKEFKK